MLTALHTTTMLETICPLQQIPVAWGSGISFLCLSLDLSAFIDTKMSEKEGSAGAPPPPPTKTKEHNKENKEKKRKEK
jgi:hypothetical protein